MAISDSSTDTARRKSCLIQGWHLHYPVSLDIYWSCLWIASAKQKI